MPSVAASAAILGSSPRASLAGLSREAEGGICDVEIEMLSHFMRIDHRADGKRDRGSAAQRIALAVDRGLDAGEISLGGGQQVFTLAGAFGGEIGIAANH